MNKDEFKQYLTAQREEMMKHRWIESEKAGFDMGQAAVEEWIKAYAKDFRENWMQGKVNRDDLESKKKKKTIKHSGISNRALNHLPQ